MLCFQKQDALVMDQVLGRSRSAQEVNCLPEQAFLTSSKSDTDIATPVDGGPSRKSTDSLGKDREPPKHSKYSPGGKEDGLNELQVELLVCGDCELQDIPYVDAEETSPTACSADVLSHLSAIQDSYTEDEAGSQTNEPKSDDVSAFIVPKCHKKASTLSPFSSLCSLFTSSKNIACEDRAVFKNNNLNNSQLQCCPIGLRMSLQDPRDNVCQVKNNMDIIKKSPKSKNKHLFVTLKAVNSIPNNAYHSASEGSSSSTSLSPSSSPLTNAGVSMSPHSSLSSSSSPLTNAGVTMSPHSSLSPSSSSDNKLTDYLVDSDIKQTSIVHGYQTNSLTKFKLMHEADVQVCFLNHTRTIMNKVLSSKFLRRWENHHIYLKDYGISSKTPLGFLERDLLYSHIEEVYVMCRWDQCSRFCIRLIVLQGSLLLQTASPSAGDQLLFSLLWRKNVHKHKNVILSSTRYDVIMKEIKGLIQLAQTPPLLDETVVNVPIDIISQCLVKDEVWSSKSRREEVIRAVASLLEDAAPSPEMCDFFSRHCCEHPRSPVIANVLTPIVYRILKRNVDFGKSPLMRRFVADFLRALHCQNDGDEAMRRFVASIHGPTCSCPHPRVLPNLVSVNLSAVFGFFDQRRKTLSCPSNTAEDSTSTTNGSTCTLDQQLQCYVTLFIAISEYEDWLPGLGQLLQPIPFPDDALSNEAFMTTFTPVMARIGTDPRCEVHEMVLGIRENKSGWLHVYCPSSLVCNDEGVLWCRMLQTLFACCCRRKRFLQGLVKNVGALLLVALRDHDIAQEMLCLMLEWRVVTSEDQEMHIVTTLQSTPGGTRRYRSLCERQEHLKKLQKKGGPRKLTLPNRSTDADVACLLSCGAFGNLECLSLAFTHVTSACAYQLIQLPALRYLNLWATQFGDAGLVIIAEHLDQLQVLNLCETPVSDKGIVALTAMTSLKKLNLNSTKLSAHTLETIKKQLPTLQELDVRYTDAW